VLTADTPVVGSKETGARTVWEVIDPAWLRVNFPAEAEDDGEDRVPAHRGGEEKATDLGPEDVDWLAERWGLPVVVKGVLHPDDARRCVDAGAAAVWVSNHGGRQLDRAVTTVEALPAVADAVSGAAEVYVDGGVRRGSDALAAAALGARAVFLGRPPLFALADAGPAGVERLLVELADEVREALRLAGAARLADVSADLVQGPS
jgi:4-hydroxymandelate oxidase